MNCHCCRQDFASARRVNIRGDVAAVPAAFGSPGDPAYIAYREASTFRPAFVCEDCYRTLDNAVGAGEINGQVYGIDGRSRGGRAALYDERRYLAYMGRQASRGG